jgi:hypothetical protein
MRTTVPEFSGNKRTTFELADGWSARRVPKNECPVPMADVIEKGGKGPDLFSAQTIGRVFTSMREKGVRLLRRHIASDDFLQGMERFDFTVVKNTKLVGTTEYPRNSQAHTAFIAPEVAARILIDDYREDIDRMIAAVPKYDYLKPAERWEGVQQSELSYRDAHSYAALEELNGDIGWLFDNLMLITEPDTRPLYVRMMEQIGRNALAYTVDQPNRRGQMIAFDNTAVLHRGVDPQDPDCEFMSSTWHEDNFGYGLGFLYPRKSDGLLMHGCSEDIVKR